jgi:hypothetical protein
MQMKAGQYAHLSFIDDVEESVREAPHHGTTQIAVDALIECRIGAEMSLDTSELVEELGPEPPLLLLVRRESIVDLGLGGRFINDVTCRHSG